MPVRPEKVEEIKAVWDSPKFKTNAQKVVHLLVIAEVCLNDIVRKSDLIVIFYYAVYLTFSRLCFYHQ